MFKPLTLVAAVLTAFSLNAFAKTELTVYTALEAEQLKTYKQAFEQANPDIEAGIFPYPMTDSADDRLLVSGVDVAVA